jgi:hypothetical protein
MLVLVIIFYGNNRKRAVNSLAFGEGRIRMGGTNMSIELTVTSQAKLEDILEQFYVRYGMEDLTAEDLIDALLDIGVDMIVTETASPSVLRDRLISQCGLKLASRG